MDIEGDLSVRGSLGEQGAFLWLSRGLEAVSCCSLYCRDGIGRGILVMRSVELMRGGLLEVLQ